MSFRAAQPTFAGGEIGKQIAARYDTSKYATALEKGRNVLLLPGGGLYNRPGFEFCDRVIDYTKASILFPFVFTVDQSYALEFSHLTMRVFSGGRPVRRPKLEITGITHAANAIVTAPGHDYEPGWRVQFEGVEGMVEINGLIATIVSVAGDNFTVDIDTTGFSAFTGDTGGAPGNAEGGTGGFPPPPTEPPGVPDEGPPPPTIDKPEWNVP